jgi:hypothetical protein
VARASGIQEILGVLDSASAGMTIADPTLVGYLWKSQ